MGVVGGQDLSSEEIAQCVVGRYTQVEHEHDCSSLQSGAAQQDELAAVALN